MDPGGFERNDRHVRPRSIEFPPGKGPAGVLGSVQLGCKAMFVRRAEEKLMKRLAKSSEHGWKPDTGLITAARLRAVAGFGVAGLWFWQWQVPRPGASLPSRSFPNHRTQRPADAVRGDAGIPPSRPPSRLLLQHALRRQRAGQAPQLVQTQGLYGLGLKTPDTQSIYPFFYGMPGQSTIDSSSRPWWRPLRFFQGLAHPWRPVGMYYQFGSYVPIYDLDPIAPGPGPLSVSRSTSTGCTAADGRRAALQMNQAAIASRRPRP